MAISRRRILQGAIAAPAVIASVRLGAAAPTVTLKISHQFPGGTIDEGDFRDRLCRKFAAELEKRTNGAIAAQVYPNSSLMKTVAQFSAVRKGALDLSLYPISYAGGEYPELNIGLMPGLVSSYAQGAAWKTSPVGQSFSAFLAEKGVIILSWIWQAGGVASRVGPDRQSGRRQGPQGARRQPRDGHGAAGGGRDHAEHAVERALRRDADRRLRRRHHVVDQPDLVPAGGTRQEPHHRPRQVLLVHARAADHVEADLRRAQPSSSRTSSWRSASRWKQFGTKEAMADDQKVAEVYAKKGAKVSDLTEAIVDKWRAIARDTAWKDYAAKTALSAELLKLAEERSTCPDAARGAECPFAFEVRVQRAPHVHDFGSETS